MGVYEHSRWKIFNQSQHPFRHQLGDFAYTPARLPGVADVEAALDYIINILVPDYQGTVATPALLPVVGNTHGDYYVVTDDGDGKAAGYVYTTLDGSSSWVKRYDMDWSSDSILAEFVDKTQYMYLHKYGQDDHDGSGIFVGQQVWGGASNDTNLTLHATRGTGGYVQVADDFRPTSDNGLDLGTASYGFKTGYFGTSVLISTLTLSTGSIVDSTGEISFDNENLTTTGTITSGAINGLTVETNTNEFTLTSGTTVVHATSSCTINQDLQITSTPEFTALKLTDGNVSSTYETIITSNSTAQQVTADRTLTLDMNDGSRTLSLFGNLNVELSSVINQDLSTDSVTAQFGTVTLTTSLIGSLFTNTNSLSITTTANDGDITLTPHGSGLVKTDNLAFGTNTISSTNTDGNIIFDPNGTGIINALASIVPTAGLNLGADGNEFGGLYMQAAGKIYDDTGTPEEFLISELMDLKSANYRDSGRTQPAQSGDALFYNGSIWLASNPDTEIDHGELSGLGDDDHTQYALLAGRSGGQTLYGSTDSGENLTLSSTSDATKGDIITDSDIRPNADAAYSGGWTGIDLGDSSYNYLDLYMKGQAYGMRLQNATTGAPPSASANTIGRLYYATDDNSIYADHGGSWVKKTTSKYLSDTSWNGSQSTQTFTVSGSVGDARTCQWTFHDNANDYEQIFCKITAISATQVTVFLNDNLPSGSYRLIGIE